MGFFFIMEWMRYEIWRSNPKNRRLQKSKEIHSANYHCSYYREIMALENEKGGEG